MNKLILSILVAVLLVLGVAGFIFFQKEAPVGSVSSPYFIGPEFSINELSQYVVRADFDNSTTTLLSFQNPLSATGTIDLVNLFNTGVATSTYQIQCGTSYVDNAAPSTLIISTLDIATSTNFGFITSDSLNPVGYVVGGNKAGSTASTSIAFGPDEYFICKATTYEDIATHNGAFSGTNNTFEGNFKIRITR
mgnify:CR=1 FL=1